MVVRHFGDRKYLSMAKTGSEIAVINDIGDVIEYDPEHDDDQRRELANATIVGVLQLDSYKACLTCKARVESFSQPLGRCSKCLMMQRIDRCNDQLSAKLLIDAPPNTVMTLHSFGAMLQRMAGVATPSEVNQEVLLTCPTFVSLTYNDKGVITGFSTN